MNKNELFPEPIYITDRGDFFPRVRDRRYHSINGLDSMTSLWSVPTIRTKKINNSLSKIERLWDDYYSYVKACWDFQREHDGKGYLMFDDDPKAKELSKEQKRLSDIAFRLDDERIFEKTVLSGEFWEALGYDMEIIIRLRK